MPDWALQVPNEFSGGGEPGGGRALGGVRSRELGAWSLILSVSQRSGRRDGSKQHEISL